MPKLTVITAIYNVEPYLRQCLDSLTGQTFRDIEFILVDDGSPDRSGEICEEYARRDARVKVIHKKNGGLSTAWNCGLDNAHGEWVTFCDPDDWVDSDYYERLFAQMDENVPDILFANGHFLESPDGTRSEVHTFDEPFDGGGGG